MTTKHTSGPWHSRVNIVAENGIAIAEMKYWPVALNPQYGDSYANACLVAASPDLLAAAIAVMREHAGTLTGSDSFAALCDAVAKANGVL